MSAMLRSHDLARVLLTVLTCLFLLSAVEAAGRSFEHRRDAPDVASISDSGFTVPLEGGETCRTATDCANMLQTPTQGRTLRYLAIARGTVNYSCTGRPTTGAPTYVSQSTSLWDVAPLIPALPNEAALHHLVPQLLAFDYMSLQNSTLSCIGTIGTYHGTSVVDIFNVAAFVVNVQQILHAPEDPDENLNWAYSKSSDGDWDMYRVVTAGGAPPQTCANHNGQIQLDYAAEYWFYHA